MTNSRRGMAIAMFMGLLFSFSIKAQDVSDNNVPTFTNSTDSNAALNEKIKAQNCEILPLPASQSTEPSAKAASDPVSNVNFIWDNQRTGISVLSAYSIQDVEISVYGASGQPLEFDIQLVDDHQKSIPIGTGYGHIIVSAFDAKRQIFESRHFYR